MTLPVLFRDVLRRWKLATAIAVGFLAGVTLYAERLPDQFEGTTIVAFSPRPNSGAGADIVRVDVPKYVEYVTARETVNAVAAELGESPSVLGGAVHASVAADSGNLFVRVRLGTPRRAADAANAFASRTMAFAASDSLLQAVLVARALPESQPAGPPRRLFEAAGLALGLLAGAAAAFLVERGRPRVRTSQEMTVVTGFPVVGHVPPTRSLRLPPAEALVDPVVGAAVRTLRTNLERISRDQPVHVLVITSSEPGEGKTTLAGAFAVAVARLDADVLLIDGDLRRPSVARAFGMKSERGLAAVLREEATLSASIRPGPVPRLRVLPTEVDEDAGDLLARRFTEVLTEARSRYDVVVIDAPPVLGGDDARTLATVCDGVLFVAAFETPARSLSEAAAALDTLGVRVLGVVANKLQASRGAGAYGAYGSYTTDRT